MGRFKLTIEYDGTRYAGWQMQKGGKTIQGEILDACRELFKNEEIDIFGAGRTDRGVHASGQVAAFFRLKSDIPAKLTAPPSGLFLEKVYYKKEEIVYQTKPVINI